LAVYFTSETKQTVSIRNQKKQILYTVSQRKTCHQTSDHIFAEYWSIFNVLLLAHSMEN